MNVHNELYALYLNKKIGKVEIYNAFEKGFIDNQSVDVILDLKPDYTLEEAAKFKKAECSYICSKNIISGIDVMLSSGETKHFSLTEKDQLNLATKMLNITMGVTELEYHSDGEPCVYYNIEDMSLICATAQSKVTLETTYYNCIAQWIAGCKTPEEIMAISYGDTIPEEYWTEPWRRINEKSNPIEDTSVDDIQEEVASENQEETPEVENSETESK